MEKINLILLIMQILLIIGLFVIMFKKLNLKVFDNTPTALLPKKIDSGEKNNEQILQDFSFKKAEEIIYESFNGEKIVFERIESINIDKYEKVTLEGSLVSNVFGAGAQIGTISTLTPKGIYTATVNPELLLKFKDRTLSTMIQKDGKIIKHAGFRSASNSVFMPILVFQLTSFLTGQYYLNGIRKQLAEINSKIDKLLIYQNTDFYGKMNSVQRTINILLNLKNPNIEDLIVLKNCDMTISYLYETHLLLLKQINIPMPDNFLTIDKVIKMVENFENSGFLLHFDIVLNCETILYLLKVIELYLNIKMCKFDNVRIYKIIEFIEEIKNWDINKSFSLGECNKHLEIFYDDLRKKINKIYDDAIFNTKEVLELREIFAEHKIELNKQLKERSEFIEKIKDSIIKMCEPQQIILEIDDNGNTYMLKEKE